MSVAPPPLPPYAGSDEGEDMIGQGYYSYPGLPQHIKVSRPDLAMSAVLRNQDFYKDVPLEVRQDNWDLADLAVNRNRGNYAHVPLSMKVMPRHGAEGGERVLDLARRATRVDGRYVGPSAAGPPPREFMLAHPFELSEPYAMQDTQMPADTKRHLLSHLYTTNQHAHLRAMGEYARTRNALEHITDRTDSWFQRLLPAGGLGRVSNEVLRDVVGHSNLVKTRERDHKTWALIQMRQLWFEINSLLFLCRNGPFFPYYDHKLDACVADLEMIVTYFCDPHYAWAVNEGDAPVLEPVPLSPVQRVSADNVADHVRQAIDVLGIAIVFFREEHGMPPADPTLVRRLLGLRDRLIALGLPPLPDDIENGGEIAERARAYLLKPPAPMAMETMFCEEHADVFPEFHGRI